MVRHDYDFPADWESYTPEEKDRWFHQERALRQAVSQRTNFRTHYEEQQRRIERKQQFRKTKYLGGKDK